MRLAQESHTNDMCYMQLAQLESHKRPGFCPVECFPFQPEYQVWKRWPWNSNAIYRSRYKWV